MAFFVQPTSRDYVCSRNGIFRVTSQFKRGGVAVDITNWRMVMQLRTAPDNTPDDPEPWLTIDTDGLTANLSGIIKTAPLTGYWTRYISNADMLLLPVNTKTAQAKILSYDVVFHEPDADGGDFCPVLAGSFQIDPGVTYD